MKKYKKLLTSIMTFLMLISIITPNVYAFDDVNESAIKVEAKSALLMEPDNGKIIFEKNCHDKFEPASVTKIMTLLLVMEAVDSGKITMADKVTISETAKKMGGSTMLLDTGEIRTVEELVKGVAIASGNDAAVALAEYLGGSEEGFVDLMNKRAQELGMENTTFKNCNGLPKEGHLMSTYDISIMSRELLKHDSVLKYTGTYMETLSEGRKTPIEMVNHNKLVRFFKGCDGLKTGFTRKAGYCISATAVRDDVRMLSVIMGAPTYKKRNKDASMLMNFGFSKFQKVRIVGKDDNVKKVKFNKKGDKFLFAKASEELKITMDRTKGKDALQKKIHIDKDKKVYKQGEVIGYLEIYMDEEVIGRVDLYSDRDLKIGGIFSNLKSNLSKLFDGSI